MSMLLTLSIRSVRSLIDPNGETEMSIFDVPDFAINHLQLRGLNLTASMLAGWSLEQFDRLRDAADKAGCPCLVLVEDTPLSFSSREPQVREQAEERVRKLTVAAHRLGCNALAIHCDGSPSDESFELSVASLKAVIPAAERLELNLLLAPGEPDNLTWQPDELTELIKRIGGFRIGSLPDFAHAHNTGDMVQTLRKLAPYAGAVNATVQAFTGNGDHQDYDLAEAVAAVRSVGFVNTVAIDYTGPDDPIERIEQSRLILQAAIDA